MRNVNVKNQKYDFDYFHINENEQYLFLQLPLLLIKDLKFKNISDTSKILYSLLLNRTSLSKKNGWIDEEGNVYIIYTLNEITEDLNCWEQKAIKAMTELREIGLIKTIRRGLNKPNIIYVMNFATELKYQVQKDSSIPTESRNCENHNSGTVKITDQDLSKSQSTYINNNKINNNKINLSIGERNIDKKNDRLMDNIPINQTVINKVVDNLHIESLISQYPMRETNLLEIKSIIIEILKSNRKEYKISGEILPAQEIKNIFLQLNSTHMEYILESLQHTDTQIKSIKNYLIKSLLNAPKTINNFYTQQANHDMKLLWQT